ncbi:hypothetical protein D0T84_02565 [Dysgonomonas sp. 521]|uniref:outer membrane protein assembly factor BamE n=1 Tax=Dysgonomonas sp. 521 TaxID=2302932 RepID=UPI0013D7A0ED|nr:outer membrane protein assembly factor BamE [Dysgonomonas sp. 521]NDV93800.1 hypothetical protein [Dysgonomonas sp. 521]
MKKLILIGIISVIFFSCGTYNTLDLNRLTTGMTKEQVIYAVGEPQRVLAVNRTQDGYQEVLEYRSARNEVYALEFWNDYLVGYEFLYDDIDYIAPAPPVILPDYGRPIYVGRPGNRPNRPNRPDNSNRPGSSNRPGNSNNSSSGRPDRPSESGRPGSSSSSSVRPSNNTRPTTKPAESVRPGTRPANTNSGTRESTTNKENNSSRERER